MIKTKYIGVVVSNKSKKTIIVIIQRRYQDLIYKKVLIKSKRYMVHDEKMLAKIGDIVTIKECAPKSHCKKWELIEIVKVY